jgi:site-specific recombinase XerD
MIDYKNHLQILGYKENSIKQLILIAWEYTKFKSDNLDHYYQYLKTRNHKKIKNKQLSNGTLNAHIYALKIYFKYLETQKLLSIENAKITLLKEKTSQKNIEVLSVDEVKTLFNNAQNSRDKAVLACLYHLGLRASEASNVKLEDIDFNTHLVFISQSKTGYQRQVPIPQQTQTIFINYLQSSHYNFKNPYFLQGLKGDLTPDGIAQIVKRAAENTKITKRVYPHLLRHSIATHLLANKMEIEQVAQFLGHRSMESTQRYTHLIHE